MQTQCNTIKNERNSLIDSARGIGILLVYFGHMFAYDSIPFRIIFNFHMPLFFVLSGMVFNLDTVPTKKLLYTKIIRNTLIPLLLFTPIGIIGSIASRTFMPTTEHGYRSILCWFAEITNGAPRFVPSAWFLSCLAFTQIAFWYMYSHHSMKQIQHRLMWLILFTSLFAILVTPLPLVVKIICPLKILSVPMALTFFSLGYIFKNLFEKSCLLSVLLFPCTAFLSAIFNSPNLAVPEFPCVWSFAISSITGVFFVLYISRIVNCKPLRFIGRNSLFFFLMECHAVKIVLALGNLTCARIFQSSTTNYISLKTIPVVIALSLTLVSAACPVLNFLLSRLKKLYSQICPT